MTDLVRLEARGAVRLITIDRPQALNAINPEVLDGLGQALRAIRDDDAARAVVLSGAGKAFVAGADIAGMRDLNALQAEAFAARGQSLFNEITALSVPVIAAVNGFALGGGCELAMACDIVLAGPNARFGQPEVRLGVIPGFGGTQRLVRRVGLAVALDLCLSARMVKAEEAARIGLASRMVEGDVLEAALELAQQIATMGPVAVRLAKRVLHENADANLASGQAAERTAFGLCFATDDQSEGMAAFLEKRAAVFSGH